MAKTRATKPSWDWEHKFGYPKRRLVGVDEVGRGCLAGAVVAAAVILPPLTPRQRSALQWLEDVADSKQVSAATREILGPLLEGWLLDLAIGVATVEEVDRLNILRATHLAMNRAVEGLKSPFDHVLIDGNSVPRGFSYSVTAIIGGDAQSISIACASILAKVWRDRRMQEYEGEYPGYGFGQHKGYGTPQHLTAIKKLGLTPLHRRSFSPVADAAEQMNLSL